jgi:hypothetical protein
MLMIFLGCRRKARPIFPPAFSDNGNAGENAGGSSQRAGRASGLVNGGSMRSGRSNLVLYLCSCALFSGFTCSALAQSLTFGWIPSVSPDIAGYILSYGTTSGIYTNSIDEGLATNATVSGLEAGTTYYFVLSAVDTGGLDSVLSPEISYSVASLAPSNAVITWLNPGNISFGTPLGASQLNATANVPGSFSYNPPAGTELQAGSLQTLYVIFTPVNTSNYNVSTNTVTLNVLAAPLTITVNNQIKTYGAALPVLTVAYSGFVNGNNSANLTTPVSLSTTALASSPLGVYPITASAATDPNYAISYVSGSLTVLQAPLIITANNLNTTYGAALPVLTASYLGFVSGDAPSSLTSPANLITTALAGSPLGVYPITVSGAADPNYAISYGNGALTVSQALLTITANNLSKTFGAVVPTLTATYSGFVDGNTKANLATPLVLSTSASSSSNAGNYPIIASGATSSNYSILFVDGSLTVSPAPLTITANNKSKTYGAALPVFTAGYSGFVAGNSAASLTTLGSLTTAAVSNSAPGIYAVTANGAVDPNYAITYINGVLTVSQASLTITAKNKSQTYGASLPVFTAGYSGFVDGETAASLTTMESFTTTANSNSSPNVYPITPGGAVDPNYVISYVNGALTVSQAPLTITANNLSNIYGAALPILTASYVGFVNGNTVTNLTTPITLHTSASSSNNVGTYPITASGATSSNYAIKFVNGSLKVTLASLIITANNESMTKGSAVPPLTASYMGFVNGDTSSNLSTQPTLITTAHPSSPLGTYPITASSAKSSNYAIAYVKGVLTVTGLQLISVAVKSATNSAPVVVEIEDLTVLPGRQVQLTLAGQPGQAYVLEMSADLVRWQPLQTNTLANASFVFLDKTATQADHRFYRVSTAQ